MESNIETLKASAIWIDYYYTIVAILVVIILYGSYKSKKINVVSMILYSWSMGGFNSTLVGVNITPLIIILFLIYIEGVLLFFKKKPVISLLSFIIIFSPIILSLIVLVINYSYKSDLFSVSKNDLVLYIRPIYYFFKSHLPYIFFIYLVSNKVLNYNSDTFFNDVIKISKFSLVVFILQQIIYYFITNQPEVLEVINIKRRYIISNEYSSINVMRSGAFFPEPKDYAYFLGISLPILFYKKQYKFFVTCIIVGFLTLSNTFHSVILVYLVCFTFLGWIYSLRKKIFYSILTIILLFSFAQLALKYISDNYLSNAENVAASILFSRLANRVDVVDSYDEDNVVMGIPLQRDMELGVYLFFRDYPWLLVTGHGIGNNRYIPAKYYWQSTMYEDKLNGRAGGGVHMRLFFGLTEYGVLLFLLIAYFLTDIHIQRITKFESTYYAFLFVTLLFAGNEFIIMCFFCLLLFTNKAKNTKY